MKKKNFRLSLILGCMLAFASTVCAGDFGLITYPKFHAIYSTGLPMSGGLLYTYIAASGVSIPTYSDYTCTTPNTNPVVLNSDGDATIYGNQLYKLILYEDADGDGIPDGAAVWSFDNYNAGVYNSNLLPATDDTYDIGSGTSQFKNGYFDGTVYADALSLGGSITFETDNTMDIGSISAQARTGFFHQIQLGTSAVTPEAFSNDTTLAESSTTKIPTQHAVKVYVDAAQAGQVVLQRPKFTYASASEITIGPGMYYLNSGTKAQVVKWNSNLTFDFGPGGSNGDSSAQASGVTQYLYIDASKVESGTTTILTSAYFVNSTTAPGYDNTLHSYVNGYDLCIMMFPSAVNSSNIAEFFHDGGRRITYADQFESFPATDVDYTWTDVSVTIPQPSIEADVTFEISAVASLVTRFYWRTNGQSGTSGHVASFAYNTRNANSKVVVTDSSQKIEVKAGISDASTITVFTDGFYLPTGM